MSTLDVMSQMVQKVFKCGARHGMLHPKYYRGSIASLAPPRGQRSFPSMPPHSEEEELDPTTTLYNIKAH